jgi:predicted amidohydrolase
MDVKKGDPRANWTRMQQQTAEAAQRGAQVVVFPELWDAGLAYAQAVSFASTLGSGLFAQVVALARQHNICILGSMYEKRGAGIYNTMPIIAPRQGVVGAYRKIHLFTHMQEHQYLVAGESPLTIDMPWGRTGFAICYDLRFPELFRRYARERVDVIIMSMQWPLARIDHYRNLARARAIENQCYLIAVNRIGVDDNTLQFGGHSCVIDPWGRTVIEAGETQAHLNVTIDLDLVQGVRRELPALEDIRL